MNSEWSFTRSNPNPVSWAILTRDFVRIHETLRTTPAMAAGVTNRLWEMNDVVGVFAAWEAVESR
jgi:hypothetical protein